MIPDCIPGYILIADEQLEHQKLLTAIVSSLHFRVKIAAHDTIFDIIHEELPDLLLLNVHIDGANGFEICTMIRNDKISSGIPIILLSETDALSEKLKGYSAGAVDYLILQADSRELLARISVHLSLYCEKKKMDRKYHDLQLQYTRQKKDWKVFKSEEQKLTTRNRFVESLLNLIPDIVFIHDIKKDINVYVNNGISKVLGYTSEELKSMGNDVITTMLHPDDIREYNQRIMPLFLNEKNSVHIQFRLKHKNNEWRWFDGIIMVYTRDSGGIPSQIFGVEHDITAEKLARDDLKRSEKHLLQSQRVALLGHYTLDIQSGTWACSEMISEIFGIPENYEKTVSGWLNLIHPEFVNEMQNYLLNNVISGKEVFNKEYKIIKYITGETIWVHGLGELEFDSSGNPIRMFGTIQDITARKIAELDLAERKRFVESIVNLSPSLIYIYNLLEKKNVYVNKNISEVLGYRAEMIYEFGDKVLSTLMHPDDFQVYKDQIISKYNSAKNGEKIKSVYRMKHCDGSWRWIESTEIIYSRNTDGSPKEVLGSAIDFTEYKKAQESLQRLNRDLITLSRCNEALVRIQDEKTLLDQICRIICEQAGYYMAWVGYLENSNPVINPVALYSSDYHLIKEIMNRTEISTVWMRTIALAMEQKQTGIIDDFADKKIQGWKDALEKGVLSAVSLPLLDEQAVLFGFLTIYAKENNAFTSNDVRLLEELADNLTFGISTLRLRLKRREAENKLIVALKEKDILIQELYHRTRNTMQIISAYLQMHGILSKNIQLQQIMEDVKDRIQAIALVHEKLYQSGNLSKIDLSDYLKDLSNILFEKFGVLKNRVKLQVETEPVDVTIDIGIPCGLVVTELLTNSFKYAFPNDLRGTVSLILKKLDNKMVELLIQDDGIGGGGMDVDISDLRTLGIPMAESIVKSQLQGSIILDNLNGYKWQIQFRTDIYNERV